MAGDFSFSTGACVSLSRRLGVQAFAGLLALAVLSLAMGVASIAALLVASRELADGNISRSIVWTLASALAGLLALRCGRWLWVPDSGPQGVHLERRSAGSLHRLIDRVGAYFGGVRVHAVWVTGDMNAAVLQRPRWGLIGPMETHFLIGLPLIHSLSDRQFPAILAHEFGHLVCQRRGLAAWGCHFRAWWFRAMDRCIDDVPALGGLIDRWSAAYLDQARHLARLEEFEADYAAAQVVGAALVGETLVEVALKERFLAEDYWAKIMAQSNVMARPSIRPYREMGLGMAAGFRRNPEQSSALLRSMLDDQVDDGGMHPSLAERLGALGVVPAGVRADERSVAARHLGTILPRLAWIFDQVWWSETRKSWRSYYRRSRRG